MIKGEKVIITEPGKDQGKMGTVIEVIRPNSYLLPSHLVKLRTKEIWMTKYNIHHACQNHRKEARYKFTYKRDGEHKHAYFCQECAKDMNYKAFGQALEKINRYEPISIDQIRARRGWRKYSERKEQNIQTDKMQCTICLESHIVAHLSDGGICQKCCREDRKIPGWSYPFEEDKQDDLDKNPFNHPFKGRGNESDMETFMSNYE